MPGVLQSKPKRAGARLVAAAVSQTGRVLPILHLVTCRSVRKGLIAACRRWAPANMSGRGSWSSMSFQQLLEFAPTTPAR